MSDQWGCQWGGSFESWRLHFRDFDGQRLFSGKVAQTLKYIHREPDNLRSGSTFRFALQITLRWARRNDNRAWYKPSTKRLPPTFLIDWHLPNQPAKTTSVACLFSAQIFHTREKCRPNFLGNFPRFSVHKSLKISEKYIAHSFKGYINYLRTKQTSSQVHLM